MTSKEYSALAKKTDLERLGYIASSIRSCSQIELLHAAMGLCTESGEIQDELKKHIFYDKPLDELNLKEELGDILWYVALMARHLEVSLSALMEMNIAKLRTRYGDKFSTDAATTRDIEAERRTLEAGTKLS